jgi:hypothetical protein
MFDSDNERRFFENGKINKHCSYLLWVVIKDTVKDLAPSILILRYRHPEEEITLHGEKYTLQKLLLTVCIFYGCMKHSYHFTTTNSGKFEYKFHRRVLSDLKSCIFSYN